MGKSDNITILAEKYDDITILAEKFDDITIFDKNNDDITILAEKFNDITILGTPLDGPLVFFFGTCGHLSMLLWIFWNPFEGLYFSSN